MKHLIPAMLLVLASCSNDNSEPTPVQQAADTTEKKQSFFPVTSYIKGQLYSIREKGLTPVKYTTVKDHTDSVMIKFDELDGLAKEFTQPVIDSTNLISQYTESKFLDQTINAFTLTYEPKSQPQDSLQLLHWDVYMDPESGKIKRVYMVKKAGKGKTLQLTWVHNQWFKTTFIVTGTDGNPVIEKEEKISWDY